MLRVLSLGAGVQSTTLLLMSLRGELPRLDGVVFADTQWEPKAVYEHLEFLRRECEKAGVPLYTGTAGNLREDGIEFRSRGWARGETSKKRYASIPVFVKNPDGSQGRVNRQCTKEYKIEVVDRIIRRLILGLKAGRPAPPGSVEHWFGITTDESRRAVFPGRWKEVDADNQPRLYGESTVVRKKKVWKPAPWKTHAYPLLDAVLLPDRTSRPFGHLPRTYTRDDCEDWLRKNLPGRKVPRSACIGCPFRSNEEWRRMRDETPDEWADAVEFDHAQRAADRKGASRRGMIVGETYVHRQLIPLDMVDLDGQGEPEGTHCGFLNDGQDGLCGV